MTMETTGPRVTVLMVAHNAGRYLAEAVGSVRAQTYPWKDLVLVDNGSTDGAVEAAAREWGGGGELVVVRTERNLGPAGGACLGLAACRGDYVARLDADDVARPERLAVQVAFLEARPELGAVGSDAWCIDETGRPVAPRLALRTAFLRRHGAGWEAACPHSSLLFRRSEAAERSYNPSLGGSEDFEWIEWLARRGRLGVVAQPLIYYRLHDESLGVTRASFHRVAGAVMRARIAAAGYDPDRRAAVGREDFGWIETDARIGLSPEARGRAFLAESKAEGNWVAAAYFATVAGQWREFPGLLCRAWRKGRGRKAVVALLLVRTVWPVAKRLHARWWRLWFARGGIFSGAGGGGGRTGGN